MTRSQNLLDLLEEEQLRLCTGLGLVFVFLEVDGNTEGEITLGCRCCH